MANDRRELLKAISQKLHEAGWDQPAGPSETSPLFEDTTVPEQAVLWLVHALHLNLAEVARLTGLSEPEVEDLDESACSKLKKRAIESLRQSRETRAG